MGVAAKSDGDFNEGGGILGKEGVLRDVLSGTVKPQSSHEGFVRLHEGSARTGQHIKALTRGL